MFDDSGNLLGDDHQAAVAQCILAGGEGNQLIAILSADAGVIEAHALDIADELIEFLGILGIVEPVVGEEVFVVDIDLEHRDDLVGVVIVDGVKLDKLMLFPEGFAVVAVEVVEHRAVLLVVAVDDHIIGGLEGIALLPDIDTAVLAVLFVEIAL